jgi:DNA-binding beta-propeller fold protein YncE
MTAAQLNVSQYAVAHRFSAPEGIAADAAGTLYVTEARGRGDVWRIRPDGVDAVANLAAFVAKAGKTITLLGITVHESGKLFVAAPDIERGSIIEISREGNRFDAPRIFRNQLGFANGIAIHGDTMFASDAGSKFLAGTVPGRVYRFDVSGATPRGGPPRSGETLARVNFPNGLAISPDGRTLFVAQTSKLQILPGYASRLHLDAGEPRFEQGPALGGWPDGLALDTMRSRLLVYLPICLPE